MLGLMKEHFEQSTYREKLLEHLLIAELLKISWLSRSYSLEVARPEVDRAGYDVVLEANGFVRHVQLKTTRSDSTTRKQRVNLCLGTKTSGCVVVIVFNESLQLGPFLFFGGNPGEPLPSLERFNVGKHTKPNAENEKVERPNIREVPHSAFTKLATPEQLYQRLFGRSPPLVPAEVLASRDSD